MNPHASTSWFSLLYERSRDTEELVSWISEILSRPSVKKLEGFVTEEMVNRGTAHFTGVKHGSLNMLFLFEFPDGTRVALRLPKPSRAPAELVAEKLENEVNWMQYFEESNVFKVLHVHSSSARGPDGIGPYILMDFVEGEELAEWLRKWNDDTPDNIEKRRFVYEQVAEMFLNLNRHKFDSIGSITKTPEGRWAVTKRPLTLDMYQQVIGVPGFPVDAWPTGPLLRSQDYKAVVANLLEYQLKNIRSLNIPVEMGKKDDSCTQQEGDNIDMALAMDIARGRFLARHAFAKPAATAHLDDSDQGPFIAFNRDFCSRNILVDPQTATITAVVDFEFTNAMPAPFARDPPMWLLPYVLEKTLDRDLFPWWLQTYEHTVEMMFIAAMKRVEARQQERQQEWQQGKQHGQQQDQDQEPPLSDQMKESWNSKTCLVNFALQRADTLDAIHCILPEIFSKARNDASLTDEVEAYNSSTSVKEKRIANEKKRIEDEVEKALATLEGREQEEAEEEDREEEKIRKEADDALEELRKSGNRDEQKKTSIEKSRDDALEALEGRRDSRRSRNSKNKDEIEDARKKALEALEGL
ncbi:hypothetical protein SCUCBS95973_001666 [Sporothrix curviconia]|uniref:Aminoglycoside phosphotransferase domain-containing protein n=1 Tax=Sporothrix curviconia TaxID=1260050 RepID=A0ABP0B0I0_9PEZI